MASVTPSCPGIPQPPPLSSDDLDTVNHRLSSIQRTDMASNDKIESLLKVDDATDNLCIVPPGSKLLSGNNSTFHATTVFCRHYAEYDGYPEYADLPIKPKESFRDLPDITQWKIQMHDPTKHKPWKPFDDDTVDKDGNVITSRLKAAHIRHKTKFERDRAEGRHAVVEDDDEPSWVCQHMTKRLMEKAVGDYPKLMEQSIMRHQESERSGAVEEQAANTLLSLHEADHQAMRCASTVSLEAPSFSVITDNEMDVTDDSELMTMDDIDHNDYKDHKAGEDDDQMKEAYASFTRAQTPPARLSVINQQKSSFSQANLQGLDPILRIARELGKVKKPKAGQLDDRPTWAKRRIGDLPDEETQNAQRKLLGLNVKLRNSCEGRPLDEGLDRLDHLMQPLWRTQPMWKQPKEASEEDKLAKELGQNDPDYPPPADRPAQYAFPGKNAEEYYIFQEQGRPLDKLWDQPDRPIGVFDKAEVDFHLENERQKDLKAWKKRGYNDNEMSRNQQVVYGMTADELDSRAQAAKEALVAGGKLFPRTAPKQRSASPLKRKRDSNDNGNEDDQADDPPEGVRRSNRARLPTQKKAEGNRKSRRVADEGIEEPKAPIDTRRDSVQSSILSSPPASPPSRSISISDFRTFTFWIDGRVIHSFTRTRSASQSEDITAEEEAVDDGKIEED